MGKKWRVIPAYLCFLQAQAYWWGCSSLGLIVLVQRSDKQGMVLRMQFKDEFRRRVMV